MALCTAGLEADVSSVTRSQYAHDASNYRLTPLAVAFPRDASDVAAATRICASLGVTITARGAGTGMAGNTIGTGLVLDFRRHCNQIQTLDDAARTVVVDPGVVLDELNDYLRPSGLMFGPDPSSHSRATIGGMLGNDACGNHSIAYGRTSDHVLELELVLADGTRCVATRSGLHARDARDEDRIQKLVESMRDLAHDAADVVKAEFDRCSRQVSGYALHHLANGLDIARMLVGSEGTLAIIVGATLQLVEIPRHRQLLLIGYPDLVTASRDVPTLLGFSPAAIEAIDRALVVTMRHRRGDESVPPMPTGDAWLFVEFADTVASADLAHVSRVVLANDRAQSVLPVDDPTTAASFWRLREDGAGLASQLITGDRGRPGWEDAAVPPEHLARYLEDLATLEFRFGYHGVLYGHFGAGCVHVRYDFDVATAAGREKMREFVTATAHLVAKYGGSISGEHGDGRARSALLSVMYSATSLRLFDRLKLAWDPTGLLNPGPIVQSADLTESMAPAPLPMPSVFALQEDAGDLSLAVARCVGIARCVSANVSAMCPTYNVTQREIDGTRGRARTLQDLVAGVDVTLDDAVAVLDNCLACKACATDCPTGVDMATYKAEILNRRYRGGPRPRSHYTLGWLPFWLRYTGRIATPLNRLLRHNAIRRVMPTLAGISDQRQLPAFASATQQAKLDSIRSSSPRALLFIDSTTRGFHPELALAAERVLSAADVPVQAITQGCCGLTLISSGQLTKAQSVQQQLLDTVERFPSDLPIIVLEPSCAVSLLQDLPRLSQDPRARSIPPRIMTFAQALEELAPNWVWPQLPTSVVLQRHCHERAAGLDQRSMLERHGVDVHEPVGCCGMGGSFGFETQHYEMSIAVAEQSLTEALDASGDAVLADGFGCRCQIEHLRPKQRPLHLAELLDSAL